MKSKTILILCFCVLLAPVILSTINTFYNGKASVNMTFTGDQNITTYIDILRNALVKNASMNLRGYNNHLSSQIQFLYYANYFNMTDGCTGSIDLAPTATYDLEVCIALNNVSISSSCITYTGNTMGTSAAITTNQFQKTYLVDGYNYSLKLHWKRVKYISMNNSLLNNNYDHGESSSGNTYTNCSATTRHYASCGIDSYFNDYSFNVATSDNNKCLGYAGTIYGNIFYDAACTLQANNRTNYIAEVQPACRIYEGYIRTGGENATLGGCQQVLAQKSCNCNAYSTTRYISTNCTNGAVYDSCPNSTCIYAGDNIAYSSLFTYQSNTSLFTINFTNKLLSVGNITSDSYPTNTYLEIGQPDDNREWNVSNTFNFGTHVTLNTTVLQQTLNNCVSPYCVEQSNGYNRISYLFHSDTPGIIMAYNLTIETERQLCLINERNGSLFNVNNLSSIKAYDDYNSTLFDFKAGASACHNFSTINNKVRIELIDYPGNIVMRYVDINLLYNDPTIRICANYEGITHYPFPMYSTLEREAILKSQYANCYVVADYTRFAYDNVLALQVHAINTPYLLYITDDNGDRVLLSGIDGAMVTQVNLDTLEFAKKDLNFDLQPDLLVLEKVGTSLIQIYYLNLDNDNTALQFEIKRLDTGAILSSYGDSDFASKNNFTLYFDYSVMGLNETIPLKMILTKTDADGEHVINRYFNTEADSGLLPAAVALTIAILMMVFGITFASVRATFGWLGLFMLIGALLILTFAVTTWYITFFMWLDIILIIFVILIMVRIQSSPQGGYT